jgi:broad-specificity NMP kinase
MEDIRIIITGFPKTGKITLANQLGRKYNVPIKSTDSLVDRSWSDMSCEIANWINEPAPWIIEGNAVVRGLRKWIKIKQQKRLDGVSIFLMTHTNSLYSSGQMALAKAIRTIWEQIRMDLADRGARISTTKIVLDSSLTQKPVDAEKKRRYRV